MAHMGQITSGEIQRTQITDFKWMIIEVGTMILCGSVHTISPLVVILHDKIRTTLGIQKRRNSSDMTIPLTDLSKKGKSPTTPTLIGMTVTTCSSGGPVNERGGAASNAFV